MVAIQSDTPVAVHIVRPQPALQGYVTFFHMVEVAGPLTDFLYPEWGNVRFALDGVWDVQMPRRPGVTPQHGALFGPTDRHSRVVTRGGRTFGFGLTPLGWCRLIREPASLLANRVRPLDGALGIDGAALQDEIAVLPSHEAVVARVEELLFARLAATSPVDAAAVAADRAVRRHPPTVAAFAEEVGITPLQLRHLCLRVFGFPTKRVLRLQRFLGALGHARTAVGEPVPDAAGQEDYFDLSHFYRDFRDFMAMSARDYFSAPRPLMAQAAAAQVRAGVTLSFVVPPQPDEP